MGDKIMPDSEQKNVIEEKVKMIQQLKTLSEFIGFDKGLLGLCKQVAAYEILRKSATNTAGWFKKGYDTAVDFAMTGEPGTKKQKEIFDTFTTEFKTISGCLEAAKNSNLTPRQKTELVQHIVYGEDIQISTPVLEFYNSYMNKCNSTNTETYRDNVRPEI